MLGSQTRSDITTYFVSPFRKFSTRHFGPRDSSAGRGSDANTFVYDGNKNGGLRKIVAAAEKSFNSLNPGQKMSGELCVEAERFLLLDFGGKPAVSRAVKSRYRPHFRNFLRFDKISRAGNLFAGLILRYF